MSFKASELPTALLAAAAFIVIVAGIQAASAIVIPFLLAVFIVSVCAPLLFWLLHRGVPNGLAVLIIVSGAPHSRDYDHGLCRPVINLFGAATSCLSGTLGRDHHPTHYLVEQPWVGY